MSDKFIRVGLIAVFLILILLIVGVGQLGLRAMRSQHADAQNMAEQQWMDVQLAGETLDYVNQTLQIDMRIVLSHDPPQAQSLLRQRAANRAKIDALFAHLQTRVGSAAEQESLNTVLSRRKAYVTAYSHVLDLLSQGKKKAAVKAMTEEAFPVMLKYQTAFRDYSSFQTDEMNQELAKSRSRYDAARGRAIFFVSLAIVLAAAIAVSVILKIIIEVRQRSKAESELRHLNRELGFKVWQRTAALENSNQKLSAEISQRQRLQDRLVAKTALLEAQLNATQDGILVVDANYQKVLQNRRFNEMFHFPPEIADDPDHRSMLDFTASNALRPQEYRERIEYLYAHADEIAHEEVEFRTGTVVDRYSAPVVGEGKYYGRIWVCRDVTERKRSEALVRLLSTTVEQSPVSILITDLAGRITYANRRFLETTGYGYEEILGQNPRILKSGQTPPEEYKRLWQNISAGKEWRGEVCNRKKNGDLYWELEAIRPITDASGKVANFLAVKEDITERRAIEMRLQQAQKLEAIGQLAAGVAHEINTPMQFIGDNTRFVQQAWASLDELFSLLCSPSLAAIDESQLRRVLEGIQAADPKYLQKEVPLAIEQSLEGIARVIKIVCAMKDFSHPGSEEKKLADINQAIETTVTLARNEWKYVAEVETLLSDDVGLVPCHIGEVNQVILNLLVNASQAVAQAAGHEPKAKGRIQIRTARDQDWVQISLRDSGCGIPAAIQPRIFDPFFTTKEPGKGTGQGLALAYAIVVKKHGGKIWFESKEGEGTTFFIRLPAQRDAIEAPPSLTAASAN
ncbi:MAG TPA: ATP-binding protein [Terriglobales bacterium]|nr:ATP-binding protein [Terriglobales bacterium]